MPPALNCILLLMLHSTIFMAVSALPHSSKDPNQLLPEQYIFEIFLNVSTPSVIYNNTDLILPLDPPDTLQRLFQSFTFPVPPSQKFPFFSYCEAYQD